MTWLALLVFSLQGYGFALPNTFYCASSEQQASPPVKKLIYTTTSFTGDPTLTLNFEGEPLIQLMGQGSFEVTEVPMGKLVTVEGEPEVDLSRVQFSLVLPAVILRSSGEPLIFDTVLVRTYHPSGLGELVENLGVRQISKYYPIQCKASLIQY